MAAEVAFEEIHRLHHGRLVESTSKDHLTHAMCSYFFCPTFAKRFFCLNFDIFCSRLSQRDEQGNLPLHYAVQCRFAKDWIDQEERHVQDAKLSWAEVVRGLVLSYPHSALVTDG